MNRFEEDVFDILKETYPEPTYTVTKIDERTSAIRWPPDFVVKRGKDTLFVVEAKGTKAPTVQTFDNHVKRAFATLALNFLRNKDDSFIVVPDGIPKKFADKYDNVLAEINSQIIALHAIPQLRDNWK